MVIFADPTYFERFWCVCEYQIGLTPYRKAGIHTNTDDDLLEHVVIALPAKEEIEKISAHLPPPLSQSSWPQSTETEKLVELISNRLSTMSLAIGSRLEGIDDEAVNALINGGAIPKTSPFNKISTYLKNLPDSLGKGFIGRHDVLWRIFHSLETNSVSGNAMSCVLHGWGGTGKTQLAAEYVWRYGATYYPGGLVWINADCDKDGLVEQLYDVVKIYDADIAPLHELAEAIDQQYEIISEKLIDIFKSIDDETPVLWVLDNIPEPLKGTPNQPLKYWCPAIHYVRLLGTTRRSKITAGTRIKIEELSPEAAVELLIGENVDRAWLEEEEWLEIAKWVGCLPLALQILHTGLSEGFINPKELLQKVRGEEPASYLHTEFEALEEEIESTYLQGVTETFHLSYSLLSKDEDACNALHFFSYLSFVPISEVLLTKAIPVRILGKLANRSWIQSAEASGKEKPERFWRMHRIISSYVRSLSTNPALELTRIADWLYDVFNSDLEWETLKECFPQVIRLLNTASHYIREHTEECRQAITSLAKLGLYLATYKLSEPEPRGIRYWGARLVFFTRYDNELVVRLTEEYNKNDPTISKHIPHSLAVLYDSDRAAQLFVRLLQDPEDEVRWKAMVYAHSSKCADILAVPFLQAIIHEKNENMQENASVGYESLFTADSPILDEIIPVLLDYIDNGNTQQSIVASRIIGRLFFAFGDTILTPKYTSLKIADELIQRILNIPDEVLATQLAKSLGSFENEDVYNNLVNLMWKTTDKEDQLRAIKILDEYLRTQDAPPAPQVTIEYPEEGGMVLKGNFFPSKRRRPGLNKPLGKFVLEVAHPDIFIPALAILCQSEIGKYGLMEAVLDILDAGDYEKVIEIADRVMEIAPGFSSPYWWRGQAYDALGQIDRAISDYTMIISMTPKFVEANYRRAFLYRQQNNLEAAIDDYTRVIEVDPEDANSYYYRALVYSEMGNNEYAERDYEKAIQLNPQDTASLHNKALISYERGEYVRALEDLDRVLAIEPSNSNSLYVKSVCHLNMAQWAESIEAISKALLVEKENPEYFYIRAYARYSAGLYDDALKDARRCCELQPDHANCQRLMNSLAQHDN